MPGYQKRVKENLERVQAQMGGTSNFIRMFGPNSNYPPPPPEPERTGPYSELFPGEDEVPKETEIIMGGTFLSLQSPLDRFELKLTIFGSRTR